MKAGGCETKRGCKSAQSAALLLLLRGCKSAKAPEALARARQGTREPTRSSSASRAPRKGKTKRLLELVRQRLNSRVVVQSKRECAALNNGLERKLHDAQRDETRRGFQSIKKFRMLASISGNAHARLFCSAKTPGAYSRIRGRGRVALRRTCPGEPLVGQAYLVDQGIAQLVSLARIHVPREVLLAEA